MTGSFSRLWSTTNAAAAMGSGAKKQPRHPSGLSTMRPPMRGPLTVARAKTAPM